MVYVPLKLVELIDRVYQFDATQKLTLKYLQDDAVNDRVLQRENRQLNEDVPDLSYFETRNMTIEWMIRHDDNIHRSAPVSEVMNTLGQMLALVKEQG